MKNICFLIGDINHSGGTERVTSIIANKVSDAGHQVMILSLSGGLQPFFELNHAIQIYQLFPQKISMKKNYLSAVFKIRKFLKKHQIDTLVVVDSISCVFTVPAVWGLKVNHICWEHFNFNVDLGVQYRQVGRRLAAKYCDHVVTLTQRDQSLWLNGLQQVNAKIQSIANPTPFENITHHPDLNFKTVLALGRFTEQKGFDLLIEAWSIVCQKDSEWSLNLIGGGEDADTLKQQAQDLGISNRIKFIDPTPDVISYYQSSSFYCMSSRFEGLPMVLLEAQAFGLPIVAFDCDTGPAELIHHDELGYLVEPLNTLKLANAMLSMMALDQAQYDDMVTAIKLNSKNFHSHNIALKWLAIL